jgi:hypothetical protein
MRVAYSLILMLSNYKEKKMNDDDFSEELDNLSLKAFGHTNWEYHADTDLKKFVVVFNVKEDEDTEELLTKGM